jgi:hypothetical protein
MAHPTDIYVALSSAPAGVEDTFEYFIPTAVRNGSRLELYFEVPEDPDELAVLRGEIAKRLEGCESFYAEMRANTVLFHEGDPRHDPKYEEVAAEREWPEAQTHVFVASNDFRETELKKIRKHARVHAEYGSGKIRLLHILTDKADWSWDRDEEEYDLEAADLDVLWEVNSAIVNRTRPGLIEECFVWCATTCDGTQAGNWDHSLWNWFGMHVKKTIAVTFEP